MLTEIMHASEEKKLKNQDEEKSVHHLSQTV